MNKSRIVVTGINGFVGHHLARELSSNNLSVIGIGTDDSLSPLLDGIVDEYYSADLIETWPDIQNVQGVIHLAGLAAVGPSFDNPQRYINGNSAMVTNMCEYFVKQNTKPRILIVSSGAVYASNQEMPLTEESLVGFNSPYAVSKVLTEHQAQYYRGRGLDCVVARPFNHIGPGQGNGFLLPDLTSGLTQASENNQPLSVGNLETKRDYTDVRDVAKAYRLLITAPELKQTLYNVCSGVSMSGNTLLKLVSENLNLQNVEVQVDPSKIRPNDPMDIYGDSSKLREDTGWSSTINIEDTVRDYLEAVQ